MGPQLKGCGRRKILGAVGLGTVLLQWGRSLRAAEGVGTRTASSGSTASMGPQLKGCGRGRAAHGH